MWVHRLFTISVTGAGAVALMRELTMTEHLSGWTQHRGHPSAELLG